MSGVRNIFAGNGRTASRPVSEAELNSLTSDQAGLDSLRDMCDSSEWAKKAIDELNEDIREFFNESIRSRSRYDALQERMAALREDVLEDIVLTSNQIDVCLDVLKTRILDMPLSKELRGPMLDVLQYPTNRLLK